MQISLYGISQDVVHNHGNLKMHDQAMVGFHIDLINDGSFDENLGLAGFYHTNMSLAVSGAFMPVFYDLEIAVDQDLFLEVGIGVKNNSNFIVGDVITPRTLTDIHLNFISSAFYNGETDLTKINGYSAVTDKVNFVFPIGDQNKLRPLELVSSEINNIAKSAYYFEDPNSQTTFPFAFDTANRADILTAVSIYEFWDLDSEVQSRAKLTWDLDSKLSNFVDKIENLRIVGWHKTNGIWENLGGNSITGDFDSGEVISDLFIPDDYSVITFGSGLSADNISLDNYLLTPNGDGINDVLHFDAIALSPSNNYLKIYNRWGRLVYKAEGYQNDFRGIADNGLVLDKNKKLPDGVYFYILELKDIEVLHQGYFTISN